MSEEDKTLTQQGNSPQEPAVIPSRIDDPEASGEHGEDDSQSGSDEIREKLKGFWSRMSPEDDDDSEEKKKPAEEQSTPEPTAEEPTVEESEKPKRRRKPRAAADAIKIAEATGRSIAEGISRQFESAKSGEKPQPAQPASSDPFENLPEDYKDDGPTYKALVEMFPERYRNLSKQLSDYSKKEEEYIKRWEEDNQGEQFNASSEEHNEFYSRIQPKIEKRDFARANREVILREAEARALKSVEPKFREWETEKRAQAVDAELSKSLPDSMLSLVQESVKELAPDLEEHTKDWESLKVLDEKNPMAAEVIGHVAGKAQALFKANLRVMRGIEPLNDQSPEHQALTEIFYLGEEKMANVPEREQRDDKGRQWAPLSEYSKMTPEQRDKHWIISEQKMSELIRDYSKEAAKKLYTQYSDQVKRWSGGGRTAPAQSNGKLPAPQPKEDGGPSVTGRSTLPTDKGAPASKTKSGVDLFYERILGK